MSQSTIAKWVGILIQVLTVIAGLIGGGTVAAVSANYRGYGDPQVATSNTQGGALWLLGAGIMHFVGPWVVKGVDWWFARKRAKGIGPGYDEIEDTAALHTLELTRAGRKADLLHIQALMKSGSQIKDGITFPLLTVDIAAMPEPTDDPAVIVTTAKVAT